MRELTTEEFNEFIKIFPNSSLFQTSEYSLAVRKSFKPLYLGLEQDGKIIAGALILIKKLVGFNYGYCPRGFLIDYSNLELVATWTKEMKKFLFKYNIVAIKLAPPILKSNPNYQTIFQHLQKLDYYHFGYNNFFEALSPRYEAVIDLNEDLETLFLNIKKSFRTKIRSAAQRAVKIYRGTVEDLIILHNQTKEDHNLRYLQDLYLHFNKNAQISVFYAKLDTCDYLTRLEKRFSKVEQEADQINDLIMHNSGDNNRLITRKMNLDQKLGNLKSELITASNLNQKKPEGINIASALIINHKTDIYMLIDGHNKEYTNFNGKHLLIWKILEKYHKLGYKKFYLGGITNPNLKENPYQGLNDFKLGFNANVLEYLGDLEIIINQTKYFMFKKSKPITNMIKK